ncbi:MAG: hypothetical protein HFF90_08080 [Oscillibacter sp.]|nr:hypothetical protein [Oscillibacter sp.]
MDKTYQRWALGFLALLLAALALCAGIVYIVDPCLYYRMPEKWKPSFFSERYQAAGLVKNVEADTVLLGSSMVANIRASWVEESFGGSALRVTVPDGYFSEFDQIVNLLFRSQSPKRLIFALDLNILIRDESGLTNAMPDYLYDENPINDLRYLLNKDTLYYSFYVMLANHQGWGQDLDDGFIWNDGTVWERYEALRNYSRSPQSEEFLPEDAYSEATTSNLKVIKSWLEAHKDTEFDIYLSPYSILAWDRYTRQGDLEARLKALSQACTELTPYSNVKFYAPLLDETLITNLDNYCDYVHHSGEAGRQVLQAIANEENRITPETAEETIKTWQTYVKTYNYDSIWDQPFLDRWLSTHESPPDWWEW